MDSDKYLEEVMVYVDRNGTVDSKHSTPMSSSLKMSYNQGDLSITMHAYAHGMGNGSCGATVKYKGKVVYSAGGKYTAGPFGTKVSKYVPGDWEKLLGL